MKKKTPNEIPELLTLKEAAILLNYHENTLRAWDKKGVLRAVRVGIRKDRRYRKGDILAFINKTSK